MGSASTIGDYDLFGEIGRGGVATVRLGLRRGEGGFQRLVACKRVHAEHEADARRLEMMVDEARLASRFNHPNVVHVLDVRVTAPTITLIMPFVRGVSLQALASAEASRACPPEIAVAIACDVLAGLEAAHSLQSEDRPLGVVHRDISPSNILVSADGVAQILDFGIAKSKGRLHVTTQNELKGKLAYMAPEQLGGQVDLRADVYGLSVVLWELLVGKALFRGNTPAELTAEVLSASVKRPSRAREGVPPSVDAIVLRGLERDVAQRWPSAGAMRRALESALPRAPASAVGAWVEANAREELERLDALVSDAERAASAATTAPVRGASPTAAPRRRARRLAAAALLLAGAAAIGAWNLRARATSASTVGADAPPSPQEVTLPSAVPESVESAALAPTAEPEPEPTARVSESRRVPERRAASSGPAPKSRAPHRTCALVAWADPSGTKHYREVCQ